MQRNESTCVHRFAFHPGAVGGAFVEPGDFGLPAWRLNHPSNQVVSITSAQTNYQSFDHDIGGERKNVSGQKVLGIL